jgi:hypothetical protein
LVFGCRTNRATKQSNKRKLVSKPIYDSLTFDLRVAQRVLTAKPDLQPASDIEVSCGLRILLSDFGLIGESRLWRYKWIMQLRRRFVMLLVLALVSWFCLSANGAQQHGTDPGGRLVVYRSPTFGSRIFLQLWIDGNKAGEIGPGRRYDKSIPAGDHVLSVNYAPRTRYQPTSTHLTVHSGQTSVFTATRLHGEGVTLQPSNLRHEPQ